MQADPAACQTFWTSDEPLPCQGDLSIVLSGQGEPVAIIELRQVVTVPFIDVSAAFAATEGEGDGSLAHWRVAHRRYFTKVCARLGGSFNELTPVICQSFRLVWPRGG